MNLIIYPFYRHNNYKTNLFNYMQQNSKQITIDELKTIIFQILFTLYLIGKDIPNFRHNDLHSKNIVLIDNYNVLKYSFNKSDKPDKLDKPDFKLKNYGYKLVIIDFEFSSIVNTILENDFSGDDELLNSEYGISNEEDELYDFYFFLSIIIKNIQKFNFQLKVKVELLKFFKNIFNNENYCKKYKNSRCIEKNKATKLKLINIIKNEFFDSLKY